MNDPKTVITNLSKRWLAKYGETLGTEEIRRHLSRMLTEYQKREIEAVFSNWSGEDLLAAINATLDLDDGAGEIRRDEPVMGLCPPSSHGVSSEIAINMREEKDVDRLIADLPFDAVPYNGEYIVPVKKPRGRPRKVK